MLRSYKTSNHRSSIKWLIVIGLITAFRPINGKGVRLVPLSAPNVYRILRETDNMDALPEGRVVTQGIAAAAGFALGVKASLAGVFLYEIITANITEPAPPTPAPPPMPVYINREICFGSRAARSLEDAEAIAEAYSRLDERDSDYPADVRKSEHRRPSRPVRNNKRYLKKRKRNSHRRRLPQATFDSNELTWARQVAEQEAATTPTATTGTTGTAPEGALSFSTSSGNDITCIVVQKQKE